jgi:hypothetical protein
LALIEGRPPLAQALLKPAMENCRGVTDMRKFLLLFTVFLSIATVLDASAANAQLPEAPSPEAAPIAVTPAVAYPVAVLPGLLTIGNQQFEATVPGLRAYLETVKSTDAKLYAQLAPDLDELENKVVAARFVLIAGLGVGAASIAYALLGSRDCASPSVNDPAFATSVAAWDACNGDKMNKFTTFTLIGMGSMIAGGIGWLALSPGRSDVFDLVNKHNQLSPTPLHFQLGYDPTTRLAYGGATFRF